MHRYGVLAIEGLIRLAEIQPIPVGELCSKAAVRNVGGINLGHSAMSLRPHAP